MTTKKQTIRRVALVGTLAALALAAVGCGAKMAEQGFAGHMADAAFSTQALPGGTAAMPGGGHAAKFLADKLGLSADQQQRIATIIGQARQAHQADHQAVLAEIEGIVTAPKVDDGKLRAFFAARQADFRSAIPDRVATLAQVRDVLTDAQRQKAADLLSRGGNGHFGPPGWVRDRMAEHFLGDLHLSDAQRKSFDAVKAKFVALHDQAPAAARTALADFARTGDQAALAAAMQAHAPALPVDEIAAAVEGLDQGQRQALVAKIQDVHAHFGRCDG